MPRDASDQGLPVVVTGVGGGGVGEQIVKALRLAATRYWIIGTDIDAASKGLMETDRAVVVPRASDPRFADALLDVCERYDARAVLCGSEAELRVLDGHRSRFVARGIFLPINTSAVLERCLDKLQTAEFLTANGFRAPAWRRMASPADAADFPCLPAVLKPAVGGGGSANVYLAQTPRELSLFAEYLLSLYPSIIAQEYVGRADAEYTVGVLSDMDGVLINSIAVRRHIMPALSNRIKVANRTGRDELGSVLVISNGLSQGDVGPFRNVCETCESIASALGSHGPLNVQCRFVEGEVVVFEINPRFSGTTSLRAMVGYNEPDVLIRRHVLGQPVDPRFAYRSGLVLRGLAEQLVDLTRVDP